MLAVVGTSLLLLLLNLNLPNGFQERAKHLLPPFLPKPVCAFLETAGGVSWFSLLDHGLERP